MFWNVATSTAITGIYRSPQVPGIRRYSRYAPAGASRYALSTGHIPCLQSRNFRNHTQQWNSSPLSIICPSTVRFSLSTSHPSLFRPRLRWTGNCQGEKPQSQNKDNKTITIAKALFISSLPKPCGFFFKYWSNIAEQNSKNHDADRRPCFLISRTIIRNIVRTR